jgi:Uncharacterized protein conserved in bacteria
VLKRPWTKTSTSCRRRTFWKRRTTAFWWKRRTRARSCGSGCMTWNSWSRPINWAGSRRLAARIASG